jgi:hypothetical protein
MKSASSPTSCWLSDEPLLQRSFDGVEHDIIDLNDQAPCLAASSFITLKDVPVEDDLVGVAINILPVSENRTVAAFSYAKKDQGIVRAALDRILGSTGDVQKYELSKLVLSRISNVLISPRHFDRWGAERAKKVADAFVRTVDPLGCDLLVVDETSMVDVMLMQALLKAVPNSAADSPDSSSPAGQKAVEKKSCSRSAPSSGLVSSGTGSGRHHCIRCRTGDFA